MHHTILAAATPDEEGRDALALAVELARPLGARVVLAGIVARNGEPTMEEHDHEEALTEELGKLRDGAPTDLPVTVEVRVATSVLRGLQDLVTELDGQMLVLGPSHHGGLARKLQGDTAADATFTATCPIAVAVRHQEAKAPRRIGVAWDGSEEAGEALEWGVQLAERTGGVVQIIRVLDPRHREGTDSPEPAVRAELDTARRAAERRAAAEAVLVWGDPEPSLVEASRGVDLLVVGSRARSPMRRALFGSSSAEVMHHGHCATVVLPHGVYAPVDTAAV